MKKGAVIYVRVSTEEQARKGISLDHQTKLARNYAAFKDMKVIEVITEKGVSGSKPLGDREGGQRLVELVHLPEVNAVISYKLDRLFRDAADCLTVTKAWDEMGADLHLVDIGGQPIDTSSAMGRFFLTVMAGVAEMERNLIIERTRATMQHMKSQGKLVGSVPYGSRLDEDGETLHDDPEEQEVIRRARKLRKKGLSLMKISKQLQKKGFLSRTEKPFYAQQISRMLLDDES